MVRRTGYFPGVVGFDESLQISKAGLPEGAVLVQPGINGLERLGIELIDPVAPLPALLHQMSAAQQAQVLGNGRAGHGEGLGDAAGGLTALAQQVENSAPRGIGEGAKNGFGGICNRTVTHNA